MLKKNRILFLLPLLILWGCNKSKDENKTDDSILNSSQTLKKSKELSESIVGKDEYLRVYQLANDTIKNWTSNNLESVLKARYDEWKIDEFVAFNKKGNKCKMALLLKSTYFKDAKQDDIWNLYGAKVENRWYFYTGESRPIIRPADKIHTPTSFDELSKKAHKYIFRNYLKRNWKGSLEINEKFFESMENSNGPSEGYGPCFKCQNFEEYVLFLVEDNWSRVDSTTF